MQLYSKLMENKNTEIEKKVDIRLQKKNESLNFRKNKTVFKIRHKFNRELRKLSEKYNQDNWLKHEKSHRKSINSVFSDLSLIKDVRKLKVDMLDGNYKFVFKKVANIKIK